MFDWNFEKPTQKSIPAVSFGGGDSWCKLFIEFATYTHTH